MLIIIKEYNIHFSLSLLINLVKNFLIKYIIYHKLQILFILSLYTINYNINKIIIQNIMIKTKFLNNISYVN